MSTLLEEAIVDAKALREAAMKTAEKSIIEKYSEEVKKGIDTILEAEMDLDNSPTTNPIDDIPLAATDGENTCTCPEEDEEIEINLSDLADLASDEDPSMGDMESTETALGDIPPEEEEEEDELMEDDIVAQILSALNEDDAPKVKAEKMKVSDQHKMPEMETTEPIKKAQELEEERVEEEDSEVTDKEDEDEKNENLNLANEFTKLQESINTLGNDNKNLKTSNAKIVEENEKLRETLQSLNEVFEDLLLQNAKLVYTNKTLEVSSLNERQKEKIVGAIRESNTPEEAKVVYETLQSAVGTGSSRTPQTLSEVTSRNDQKMVSRKNTNNDNQMPVSTRWKTLAGIK